jgi:hypothetical protein
VKKPVVQLTGTDGNVFSIIGRVSSALKQAGQEDKAKELTNKAFACKSYQEVLSLLPDYVTVK